MKPVDLERFWADDELAHRDNCFSKDAPQVALGIRMSERMRLCRTQRTGQPMGHHPARTPD